MLEVPLHKKTIKVRVGVPYSMRQRKRRGETVLQKMTGQVPLFPECRSDPKDATSAYAVNCQPSASALGAQGGSGLKVEKFIPSRAVSPLINMGLEEVCGFCGCEVHPPGCVIPDYEELGAFCNQDCADRRFRTYLEETPE